MPVYSVPGHSNTTNVKVKPAPKPKRKIFLRIQIQPMLRLNPTAIKQF